MKVARRPAPQYPHKWRASASPENDRTKGNIPDDEALQSELRAKVNELFGGRQNVSIDFDTTDSEVQFSVKRGERINPMVERFRSTRYIVTFIVVVSLVTGTFFTALYYSGAIHGYDPSDENHYEMPTYGTRSYVDPYELLQRDKQVQDSKSQ